jgi:hypothetical protein
VWTIACLEINKRGVEHVGEKIFVYNNKLRRKYSRTKHEKMGNFMSVSDKRGVGGYGVGVP